LKDNLNFVVFLPHSCITSWVRRRRITLTYTWSFKRGLKETQKPRNSHFNEKDQDLLAQKKNKRNKRGKCTYKVTMCYCGKAISITYWHVCAACMHACVCVPGHVGVHMHTCMWSC
jgi:hypothetical protein